MSECSGPGCADTSHNHVQSVHPETGTLMTFAQSQTYGAVATQNPGRMLDKYKAVPGRQQIRNQRKAKRRAGIPGW